MMDYQPQRDSRSWTLLAKQIELENRALEFYVQLMRPLRRRFGDDTLDVAEQLRRSDGEVVGRKMRLFYSQPDDPRALIHDELERYSDSNFARKIPIVFSTPSPEQLELVVLHCPAGSTFRHLGEPELGLSWCAYDFGYAYGLGDGRLALLAPGSMHLGHGFCMQCYQVTADSKEAQLLMAPEVTGWRRLSTAQDWGVPLGDLPHRARFFPNPGLDKQMNHEALEARVATLYRSPYVGFIRLVQAMANHFGKGVFAEVGPIFEEHGVAAGKLQTTAPDVLQGWFWESESGLD